MISAHIRRMAVSLNKTTGRSIQEILCEVVNAIRSGVVYFSAARCTACGSEKSNITHVQRGPDSTIRYHKCQFCRCTYKSIEQMRGKMLDESNKPIAPPKKKPHIRKRGA